MYFCFQAHCTIHWHTLDLALLYFRYRNAKALRGELHSTASGSLCPNECRIRQNVGQTSNHMWVGRTGPPLTMMDRCAAITWTTFCGSFKSTPHMVCARTYRTVIMMDSLDFVIAKRFVIQLASMAWNLFNNSKNRFYHRKTGFKVEKPVLNR